MSRASGRMSPGRWAWSLVRLDVTGVVFAAVFFCLSLTPSLLPRDWVTAGIIGGINAAIGYGVGVLIAALTRRVLLRRRRWWPPARRVRLGVQGCAIAVSIAASMLMLVPAAAWQRDVAELMGTGPVLLRATLGLAFPQNKIAAHRACFVALRRRTPAR